MRLGNGSLAALIVCYAPMSRFTRNGFTSRRIRFARASSRSGDWPYRFEFNEDNNCRADALPASRAFPIHISAWQAMRLPYNYCSSPRRITSSLHLRLSKWVVTDRRLHKSDRSPASAKRRYYDQHSVARPVIPEANPTRVRRDTLLQRQNRH